MKFLTSSTELQKALGNIGGVIPSKSPLPILENFLFQVSENKLKITATDLDTSMSVNLKVKGSEDGVVAIPAKRLFETVRALPSLDIEFSVEPDNNRIVMSTSIGEYKLTGESSENYPTLPSFTSESEMTIENETLRRLISKTSFAVSSDELRPAMMGVFFQIRKNDIRAAATDGHRLVRLVYKNFSSSEIEKDIIVPAKALNLVLKSANDNSSNISFSERHIMFSFGESLLISKVMEEKYPNYESVIPLENDKKLVVEKNQLIASVRRTSLYASSTTHQVRLSLKKGTMTVSAEDIDFGSEAKETFPCDYSAEPMDIGFNASYIIDVLSHVDTDEAVFMLSSPARAGIVQPSVQREGEDLLMLVMPVRLNA